MSVWRLLWTLVMVGLVGGMLWFQAPRLWAEIGQAERYKPATASRITSVRCRAWLWVVASECRVEYAASGPGGVAGSFADWRFGRPPEGPYALMARDGDPARVTTDASLATTTNRLAFLAAMAVFGLSAAAVAMGEIGRRAGRR